MEQPESDYTQERNIILDKLTDPESGLFAPIAKTYDEEQRQALLDKHGYKEAFYEGSVEESGKVTKDQLRLESVANFVNALDIMRFTEQSNQDPIIRDQPWIELMVNHPEFEPALIFLMNASNQLSNLNSEDLSGEELKPFVQWYSDLFIQVDRSKRYEIEPNGLYTLYYLALGIYVGSWPDNYNLEKTQIVVNEIIDYLPHLTLEEIIKTLKEKKDREQIQTTINSLVEKARVKVFQSAGRNITEQELEMVRGMIEYKFTSTFDLRWFNVRGVLSAVLDLNDDLFDL